MSDDDDRRQFRAFLDGVTPIEQDRVVPARSRVPSNARPTVARARFSAVDFTEQPDVFHAGGLQHGALRRLRRGDIRPGARLDLHGYRRDRAQRQLESFLDRAVAHGERCVLVIHGKGSRSESQIAVLRQMVRAVLVRHPMVLAYCPAAIPDGGEGASYVYLKRM